MTACHSHVTVCNSTGPQHIPPPQELRENEFGYRKRIGEEAVRASGLPHAIVQAASIDDVRTEEGLELKVPVWL